MSVPPRVSAPVAAATGALTRGGTDIGAHGRDRVRLSREEIPLFESPLGGKVQVATAVRADRARLLALDVALQPRGVDGLNEEFLGVEGHEIRLRASGETMLITHES